MKVFLGTDELELRERRRMMTTWSLGVWSPETAVVLARFAIRLAMVSRSGEPRPAWGRKRRSRRLRLFIASESRRPKA